MNLHAGKFDFFECSADAMQLRHFARLNKLGIAMTLHKEGNEAVALLFVAGAANIRRIQDACGKQLVVAEAAAK
jgi:16S rRNA G527 N7-methylase RsmG